MFFFSSSVGQLSSLSNGVCSVHSCTMFDASIPYSKFTTKQIMWILFRRLHFKCIRFVEISFFGNFRANSTQIIENNSIEKWSIQQISAEVMNVRRRMTVCETDKTTAANRDGHMFCRSFVSLSHAFLCAWHKWQCKQLNKFPSHTTHTAIQRPEELLHSTCLCFVYSFFSSLYISLVRRTENSLQLMQKIIAEHYSNVIYLLDSIGFNVNGRRFDCDVKWLKSVHEYCQWHTAVSSSSRHGQHQQTACPCVCACVCAWNVFIWHDMMHMTLFFLPSFIVWFEL